MPLSSAFVNAAAIRPFGSSLLLKAHRLCNPTTFTGTTNGIKIQPKPRTGQFSTTKSKPRPTMSASLPSTSELLNGRFPSTVELAGTVFRQVGMTRPDLLSALLSTSDGARGLFVALLADKNLSLGDVEPPDNSFIDALINTPGNDIRELAVKNVVMPGAMVIQYERMGDLDKALSSRLTRDRALRLLSAWTAKEDSDMRRNDGIRQVVQDMIDALANDKGPHATFARKWNYDDEQRRIMVDYLQNIL